MKLIINTLFILLVLLALGLIMNNIYGFVHLTTTSFTILKIITILGFIFCLIFIPVINSKK